MKQVFIRQQGFESSVRQKRGLAGVVPFALGTLELGQHVGLAPPDIVASLTCLPHCEPAVQDTILHLSLFESIRRCAEFRNSIICVRTPFPATIGTNRHVSLL